MTQTKARCRYLLRDGTQCLGEALMPEHSVLLCIRHMVNPLTTLEYAARQEWTPEQEEAERKRYEKEIKDKTGVVYYIQFRDRIKIGTSTDLRNRLQSLPFDRILATERGGHDLEQRRHKQFANCRAYGEWFRADDEALQAHIRGLQKTATRRRSRHE